MLLAWENEALLAVEKLGNGKLEIVVPTSSILAEPPVAVVEKNVERHGTRAAAQAYFEFLYTPEGQELAAKHNYRPRDAAVAARYASRFPKLRLVTIDGAFGGWEGVPPTSRTAACSTRSTRPGCERIGRTRSRPNVARRERAAAARNLAASTRVGRSATDAHALIVLRPAGIVPGPCGRRSSSSTTTPSCSLLARLMEAEGWTPITAGKGHTAITKIASEKPAAAVVDVLLPDMMGYDVAHALRNAQVPFVFMTGVFKGAGPRGTRARHGAAGYFEKPFDARDLVKALRALVPAQRAARAAPPPPPPPDHAADFDVEVAVEADEPIEPMELTGKVVLTEDGALWRSSAARRSPPRPSADPRVRRRPRRRARRRARRAAPRPICCAPRASSRTTSRTSSPCSTSRSRPAS